MKKVILDMLVTLDGFFEGPNGELDWALVVWDEESRKYSNNDLDQWTLFYTDVWLIKRLATKNVDELGPETESTIEFVNNVNNIKKVGFFKYVRKS